MLKIVDSHVHFWNPAYLHYGWLESVPSINREFLPEHFPAEGDGWQMDALVFVQADCDAAQGIQEAAWVSSLAQRDSRIKGMVAFAPLEQGEAARPVLEQLRKIPLVKGIRRLIQSEAPGFCIQPEFVEGVKLLAEFGFSFDICVRHHQLADAVTLVEQCPEITFVLDHIGKPDIQAGLMSPWQENIRRLANFPNVMCKLSGMITEADLQSWTQAELQPYFDTVLEAFGVERVMYGSDTPVIQLAARHESWLATVLDRLEQFSPQQIEQIMGDNARQFYWLPPSA